MKDIVIHWMRRDMRLHDNRTLLAALDSGLPVLVAFLFDQEILDRLDNAQDRRVTFIHREASEVEGRAAGGWGRFIDGSWKSYNRLGKLDQTII